MSDYANLRTVIADEINRSDLGAQINREINSAISHYEPTRTKFNEVRDWVIATTVAGTRYYSLTVNFLKADVVKLVQSSAWTPLTEKSWEWIDNRDTDPAGSSSRGIPSFYTIYANEIRVWPIPNGAYTLQASYIRSYLRTSLTGSFTTNAVQGASLTPTTTASHNNRTVGWTLYARQLIVARAKAAVQMKYLRRPESIAEAAAMSAARKPFLSVEEEDAYLAFIDRQTDQYAVGKIEPYTI